MTESLEPIILKIAQAEMLLADARLDMQRIDDDAYKSESFKFLLDASDDLAEFVKSVRKEGKA